MSSKTCDVIFSSPYLFLCIWSTPLPIKEGKTYNECLKTQLPYPWNILLFVNDHFILQELIKSAKLEESMKELDIEKRRTDSLLYQMIPRTVADRLRQGEPALNTCEVCKFHNTVPFTCIDWTLQLIIPSKVLLGKIVCLVCLSLPCGHHPFAVF